MQTRLRMQPHIHPYWRCMRIDTLLRYHMAQTYFRFSPLSRTDIASRLQKEYPEMHSSHIEEIQIGLHLEPYYPAHQDYCEHSNTISNFECASMQNRLRAQPHIHPYWKQMDINTFLKHELA